MGEMAFYDACDAAHPTCGAMPSSLPRRRILGLSAFGILALAHQGTAWAADKTVVLGCSVPLSGPAAPTGITTQRAVEHAFDLVNTKGIMIGGDRYTITPH